MLKRESPDALYKQIANDLLSGFYTQYSPGDRLPSESQLMESYGVSRVTVRRALESLEERELVVRKQGKGTFVTVPRIRQDLQRLDGFYASLLSHGVNPDARLRRFEIIPATPQVQAALQTDEDDVLLLERYYRVDDRPLAVVYSYFHASMANVLTREAAERHPTNTLLTHFAGLQIDRAELSIRVQPADREVARLLEVPPSTGLLGVDRLTYCSPFQLDAPNIPSKYSRLHLRSDLYEFSITVKGAISFADGFQTINDFD